MRKAFYEYYKPTPEEVKNLWENGLIVFDTNVLLSLYRRSNDAREDILSVMRSFSDRLWLPFQVGYEFHENRLIEATRPIDAINRIPVKFDKLKDEICREYENNPYVNLKYIKDGINSLAKRIQKKTNEWIEACPSFLKEDKILSELTSLYDGKIGGQYNESKLDEIYRIGEDRYSKKIPPGYKDAIKKDGARHQFGDLIIWFQLIDKAKESKCGIIFVTDDQKEDWWQEFWGDKIGPRRELISEFRKNTNNQKICFYTTDRFLSYAKEKSGIAVKKKTIEEVKESNIDWSSIVRLLADNSQPGQVSFSQIGTDAYNPFLDLYDFGKLSSSLLEQKNIFSNIYDYYKHHSGSMLDEYSKALKEIRKHNYFLDSSTNIPSSSNRPDQPGTTKNDDSDGDNSDLSNNNDNNEQ